MFGHVGIGASGTLVHDVSVVDSMVHFARVAAIAESGKFRAIADFVALRVDNQGDRQWWACDGWDAAVAEVGAALGIGRKEASGQMSIAVALCERLPKVAAVFADGGVSARTVGTICWRTRLVEDYIPRAQRVAAASQEAAAAEGTLSERAQRVAVAAKNAALEVPVKKKSHKVLKTLGWLTVAGAAGCAAYVLWRRSQPVEDPWAEEYWEDSEESLGEAGEAVSEKVEETVDAAQDKVDDVVGAAEDKLGD